MSERDGSQVYEMGEFRVDAAQRRLFTKSGARVSLSSRAFELLLYLVRHPGELLDKNQLMDAVWPNTAVEENNLNQSISALRKALGERPGDHKYLVTEPGRGYRLVVPIKAIEHAAPQLDTPTIPANVRRKNVAVAVAIGAALGTAVLMWVSLRDNSTRDPLQAGDSAIPAAQEAYRRARAYAERTTRSEADIQNAILAFEEAVRLDPSFAKAWAQLSRRHANLIAISYDRSPERRAAAQAALRKAMELAPDTFDTQMARGYYVFRVEVDLREAEAIYHELAARDNASANVSAGLAQVMRDAGRWDESLAYYAQMLVKDIQNPYSHAIICEDYLTGRELDLALKACDRALDLLPNDVGALALKSSIYQARGDVARARDLLNGIRPAPGDWRTLRIMSHQLMLERDSAAAQRLLDTYLSNPDALGARRGALRRRLADAERMLNGEAAAKPTYELARHELMRELERQPENPSLIAELALVEARLGDHGAAQQLTIRCDELAARIRRDTLDAECLAARTETALLAGRTAEARQLLEAQLTRRGALPPLTPALLELDPRWSAELGHASIADKAD
jgi:DNA-binding winged helix-turn-helix (wHTH) protein/Flp pilus assembly protein TadD